MIDLEVLKAGLAEYDPTSPKCQLQIVRHRTDHDPFSGDYDMVTYSPCCRPEGHEGECRNSRSVGWPDFATVSALLAEIERLRLDRADIDHAYAFARNKAMLLERAAVVAWLREQAADWEGLGADACIHEANTIERGDHRRERDK
jgi:hypothetical protein